MIAATPKECSMKKTILASIILSLGVAALPAQAKNSGSYISRAKAVPIAKPIKIKRTNDTPPPSNPAHGKRECRCQDKVK